MTLDIRVLPVLSDNYVFLIHDPATGATACVDPAVAPPVIRAAQDLGWSISHILVTHPHRDHTDGIADIVHAFGSKVYGSRADLNDIPKCDVGVGQGDEIKIGGATCTVFDVPGHTAHHVAYYFAGADAVFVGDTLFSLGCGRLLGGTAAQMWNSLKTLRTLPADTRIFCAHEYTNANADFALSVDADNAYLQARAAEVLRLREAGQATVPTTMDSELKCNPLLRCGVAAFQDGLSMTGQGPEQVFADLRRQKDRF